MDRHPNQTVRRLAQEAWNRLAADLKAGRSDALSTYLTAMGRFRSYSWQNVLLVSAQRPEATHVAGIHTWNDLGRMVKRGEKGILIFAPDEAKDASHPRRALSETDPLRMSGFRAASVFDVSQTEGRPLPEPVRAAVDPDEYRVQVTTWGARQAHEGHYDRGVTPAVAYVVSRGLGLEPEGSPADWNAFHADDERALAKSLAIIQKASRQILNDLFPQERSTGHVPTLRALNRSPLDREGFGQFHRRYRDRVVQSIAGFVRDQDTAQDIAAKAFQIGWEKRDRFRGDASLYTWIQAIARNAARNSVQRAHRVQWEPLDRANAREIPAAELFTDPLEKREERTRLGQSLARLPAQYRRALIGHFVDGLSIRELAHSERVPYGTVLSRIHKGKQLLRQAW
jgi:RNA polymerase sigma factor (sigma-70 family)